MNHLLTAGLVLFLFLSHCYVAVDHCQIADAMSPSTRENHKPNKLLYFIHYPGSGTSSLAGENRMTPIFSLGCI